MKEQDLSVVIAPEQTITGFNFAFTEALLNKLKSLNASNRIYAEAYENGNGTITDIAAAVVSYLSNQVHFCSQELDGIPGGGRITEKSINGLIAHAEEFLRIFKRSE